MMSPDTKLILTLVYSSTMCGTLYLNAYAIMPLYSLHKFGNALSTAQISLACSFFYIPAILFSPFYVKLLPKFGRKKSILMGQACLIAGNIMLSTLTTIGSDRPYLFMGLTMFSRFLLGMGDSVSLTSTFSIVASHFTHNKQKYIGFVESSLGFGEMVGPPLASFVYGYGNLTWCFIFFTVMQVINLISLLMFLPNEFDDADEANSVILEESVQGD